MKKLLSSIKQMLNCAGFIFRIAWESGRGYCFLLVFSILANTAGSLNVLVWPKYILDSLFPIIYIEKALVYAGLMIWISLILSLLQGWLSQQLELYNFKFTNLLNQRLYEKMLKIRYVQLEDTQRLDELESAKKAVNEAGVSQTINLIGGILSAFITILSVSWIITDLSVWILVLAVAVSFVNAGVNIIVERFRYRHYLANRMNMRKMHEIFQRAVMPEYGKEARLFNLSSFCKNNYFKARAIIDQNNFRVSLLNMKTGIFTALAYAIEIFLVYIYVSGQLVEGRITVGDFSLYISSILQFSAQFSAIITSIASLFTKSQYINCLRDFLQQGD